MSSSSPRLDQSASMGDTILLHVYLLVVMPGRCVHTTYYQCALPVCTTRVYYQRVHTYARLVGRAFDRDPPLPAIWY